MARTRAAMAGAVLLLLAACGGGEEGGTAAEPTPAESAPVEMSPTTGEPAGGESEGGEVMVSSTSLGDVLTDGKGMTLYMFDPDKQGESTCYDQCATAWPPLVVGTEATAGDGVDGSLLGTTTRTDGTTQVTYNKWPLYYWQNDKAPGDVTGQAVNDVWWVVGADGEPVRTPAATQ
jgi:predicted lipoprotein with Yx(FWY)xxD motif